MVIWEEEDNIDICRDIPCVIYADMPRARLANKKEGTYKAEVPL